MYHQVILKTLQYTHNIFMCFVWFAEKGVIFSLHSFHWFLVIEKKLFYCAVRTESFNKMQVNLRHVSANGRQVWCRLDYKPSDSKPYVIFFSPIAVGALIPSKFKLILTKEDCAVSSKKGRSKNNRKPSFFSDQSHKSNIHVVEMSLPVHEIETADLKSRSSHQSVRIAYFL